jgi:hypothetical protein
MWYFTGSQRNGQRRRLLRVRSEASVCEHRTVIGAGDHVGRCLECGAYLATPFTVRRPTSLLVTPPSQGERVGSNRLRSTNRLAMDEVRLPDPAVPASESRAA